MIRKLHHNAYRCRDSEQTRRFYEGFLGLRLACTLEIGETVTGRKTHALHTFYELEDGSYLAFFEVPDMPFEFRPQHAQATNPVYNGARAKLDRWQAAKAGNRRP